MRRGMLVLAVAAMLLVSGCGVMAIRTVEGSGNVVSEARDVEGFDRVIISGIGTLYIEQGEDEGLVIEAEDNILPYLESEVRFDTLELGVDTPGLNLRPTEGIRYHLTVRSLADVETSGTADIFIESLTATDLHIVISGLGDVTISELTADSLRTDVSGSGDILLAGYVPEQEINISGLGSYDAGELESDIVEITMSGSSSATVWANDRLDVEISGVGTVEYYGSPAIQQQISGLGSLSQAENR